MFAALLVPLLGGQAQAVTPDNSCRLQISQEVDTNANQQPHTLTATVENAMVGACNDAGGYEIDFEFESGPVVTFTATGTSPTTGNSDADNSPTSPDATCTAPQPGAAGATSCTIQFTANSGQGTNIIRGWVDDDKNNATADADATEGRYAGGGTSVNNPAAPGDADANADCRPGAGPTGDNPQGPPNNATTCQQNTAVPGARTEPDDTDVVEKTWTQQVPAACIDAEPETDTNASGTDHTIEAQVTNGTTYTSNPPGNNNNDLAGTFDCAGTAIANSNVVVTIVQPENPNIFIKSVNGVATGGPTAGGPNSVTAATDANGRITVVISCVSGAPANCNGTNNVDFQVQGANNGPNSGCGNSCDRVAKTWSPGGQAAQMNASPNTATNTVGQTHTITCRIADGNNVGVAGQNCDANITAGPNANQNVDNNGATPLGYVGQCTTDANGNCTITYTSNQPGTDTIRVFADLNGDDVQNDGNFPNTANPTFEDIQKTWVLAGAGTADVDIDMRNADFGGGETDCNDLADFTDDQNDDSQAANPTSATVGHRICAEHYSSANARLTGAISARITGVGAFFNDLNGDGVKQAGEADLGQGPINVEEAGTPGANPCPAGFNCISIYSTAQGTSTVEVSVGGQTATGTKTWGGGAARKIAGTPDGETIEPNERVDVSFHVTDRNGNAVQGQNVQMTITGPAEFDDPACFGQNTQVCNLVTGNTGDVSATIRSTGAEGAVTVQGELGCPGGGGCTGTGVTNDVGDQDGPNDTDDACDQPANDPDAAGTQPNGDPGAPAGNCEDNASINVLAGEGDPECSDGLDNDGDGDIDGNDPGCADAADDDESDDPPPPPNRVDTDVTFGHNNSGNSPFFGRVDSDKKKCEKNRLVKVKKTGSGNTVAKDRTDGSGNWRKKHGKNLKDGRYFAKVKKKQFTNSKGRLIICRGAKSPSFGVKHKN